MMPENVVGVALPPVVRYRGGSARVGHRAGAGERADGLIEAEEIHERAGGDRVGAALRKGICCSSPQRPGADRGHTRVGVGA